MTVYAFLYKTAIGNVIMTANDLGITRLMIGKDAAIPVGLPVTETPVLRRASIQLAEYLAGTRKEFDVPLAPDGTPFMKSVWNELTKIPYGQTRSYGQIAVLLHNEKAARAVGLANNRNPIAIFIPCHRVIGKNGGLTGYRWGLDIKEKLLQLEQSPKHTVFTTV